MKKLLIPIVLIIVGIPSFSYANEYSIDVQYRVKQKQILLRWAPKNVSLWQQTNESGFWLERYTLSKNGEILTPPEYISFSSEPIRRYPQSEWGKLMETSNEAAVIAQAFFGESFSLSTGTQSWLQAYNSSQEMEQRYAFSLYAADQDFKIACAAAWGFADTSIQMGEHYLYRIIAAFPEKKEDSLCFGSILIYAIESPLPRPFDLKVEFSDKQALLSWDAEILNNVFGKYIIEKSTNKKHFVPIEGAPLAVLSKDELSSANIRKAMYYIDTLVQNETTYYYRIRGITCFGELSEPSDTVFGKGIPAFEYIPQITKAYLNSKRELEIEWIIDEQASPLLSHFELHQSKKGTDGFKSIQTIDKQKRKNRMKINTQGNYFMLSAISKYDQEKKSFPVFVQDIDTIPPHIPKGLNGNIDTLGNLTIQWEQNTDIDIYAYKLFWKFSEKDTWMLIKDTVIKDTIFSTLIDMKSLNHTIFTSIVAVDERYNQSAYSLAIILEKPDIYPPLAPSLLACKADLKGVFLEWEKSPSFYVFSYQIYRKENAKDTNFQMIMEISAAEKQVFTDISAESNANYSYAICALKKNGLSSEMSNTLNVKTIHHKKGAEEIKGLEAVVDQDLQILRLSWTHTLSNIASWEIYKSIDNGLLVLWKTLSTNETEIIDENVKSQQSYRYMLRGIYNNGQYSPYKEIQIKF